MFSFVNVRVTKEKNRMDLYASHCELSKLMLKMMRVKAECQKKSVSLPDSALHHSVKTSGKMYGLTFVLARLTFE